MLNSSICHGFCKACCAPLVQASAATGEEVHEPLRTGLSALLLLGAAVGVFLQRMQEALLATGSAALLLLQQLAGHGSVHARALALKARRSLRRSRAGERIKELRQNAQSFVEQLPEVRRALRGGIQCNSIIAVPTLPAWKRSVQWCV